MAAVSLQTMTGVDALIAAIVGAPKIAIFPDSFPSQLEKAYMAARFCGSITAVAIIQDAAEKQHHLAEAYLGQLYENGCMVLNNNTEQAQLYASRALPWLRTEAARGNNHAQYHLGCCYIDARGVDEDKELGMRWMKMAAIQGNARAQCYVGTCHKFSEAIDHILLGLFLSRAVRLRAYTRCRCYARFKRGVQVFRAGRSARGSGGTTQRWCVWFATNKVSLLFLDLSAFLCNNREML
jgi:hypothetical protein